MHVRFRSRPATPQCRSLGGGDGACAGGVVRPVPGAGTGGGLDGLAAAGRAAFASRRIARLLPVRRAEGADAADARRLRHGRGAVVLLARAHARPAGGPARRGRQCRRRRARHRDALLLLLGRAAVHRLRLGRRAARRHLLLPDRGADDQRGGARPAVRAARLEGRADLSRLRPDHRHRRGLGDRPVQAEGWLEPWVLEIRAGAARPAGSRLSRGAIASGPAWTRCARSSAASGSGSSPASPPAR